MKEQILSHISTECPWRDTLYWYDTIDSTNTQAKELAKDGAPGGTVLIAGNLSRGYGCVSVGDPSSRLQSRRIDAFDLRRRNCCL